jgi:hypothetical protein
MANFQFFRGNGRAVVVNEKIYVNAGDGFTYLISSEVPEEVTNTIKQKKVHRGPGWQPIYGFNPELETAQIGDVVAAWPSHIKPCGGCDILKRIA